jgi:hypothetical protein
VANLGVAHGGLDAVLGDGAVRAALGAATAVALQLPGAATMSNRFYTVHPRRNDRFVRASGRLRSLYPEVDFTEFHFIRHLLSRLAELSPERFAALREEIRTAWTARLDRFLDEARVPVHLLWLARRAPEDGPAEGDLGADPLFVDRAMLDAVSRGAASLTVVSDRSSPGGGTGAPGMFFAPRERAAARILPGAETHTEAARILAERIAPDASAAPAEANG